MDILRIYIVDKLEIGPENYYQDNQQPPASDQNTTQPKEEKVQQGRYILYKWESITKKIKDWIIFGWKIMDDIGLVLFLTMVLFLLKFVVTWQWDDASWIMCACFMVFTMQTGQRIHTLINSFILAFTYSFFSLIHLFILTSCFMVLNMHAVN